MALTPLLLSSSPETHPSNISLDLPPALTKAASAGDLEVRFVGTNGSERKEVVLKVEGDKVSGQMTVKPGKWTLRQGTKKLGEDPALGINASWALDDGDGDKLDTTTKIFKGKDCPGTPVQTVKGTATTATLPDLDPRTDYSYTVGATDGRGGSATSACFDFTTGDKGLVGWWRFDDHPFIEEADICDDQYYNPEKTLWKLLSETTFTHSPASGPLCDSSGLAHLLGKPHLHEGLITDIDPRGHRL